MWPHPLFVSSVPVDGTALVDLGDPVSALWSARRESWYPIDTDQFRFNGVLDNSWSLTSSIYTALCDVGLFPELTYVVYLQAETTGGYKAITKITFGTRLGLEGDFNEIDVQAQSVKEGPSGLLDLTRYIGRESSQLLDLTRYIGRATLQTLDLGRYVGGEARGVIDFYLSQVGSAGSDELQFTITVVPDGTFVALDMHFNSGGSEIVRMQVLSPPIWALDSEQIPVLLIARITPAVDVGKLRLSHAKDFYVEAFNTTGVGDPVEETVFSAKTVKVEILGRGFLVTAKQVASQGGFVNAIVSLDTLVSLVEEVINACGLGPEIREIATVSVDIVHGDDIQIFVDLVSSDWEEVGL